MFRKEGCLGIGAVIRDCEGNVFAAISHESPMLYGLQVMEAMTLVIAMH